MQLSPKRLDNQFIQGDAATSRLLCGPSMQIAADPHIEAAFERLVWLNVPSRTRFQVLVDGITERLPHLAYTEAIEQDQVIDELDFAAQALVFGAEFDRAQIAFVFQHQDLPAIVEPDGAHEEHE